MSCIKFGKYGPQREIIISDKENGNSMQHLYWFSNGYGAGVSQNRYSKGQEAGLYELAVLRDVKLGYSTIIGYLTADEVAEHLSRIESLPDLKKRGV